MLVHVADVSIRSLILALMAAAVLAVLGRRRTAALQHAVWVCVTCGMLALFAFGWALPRVALPVMPSGPEITMPRIRSAPLTTPHIMEEAGTPIPIPAVPHGAADWRQLA